MAFHPTATGLAPTLRFPGCDWRIRADRGVLTLGLASIQGGDVVGEFREFSGCLLTATDRRSARLSVRAVPGTLGPNRHHTARNRPGDDTELTWDCVRLRLIFTTRVQGEAVIRHRAAEAATCVRGQLFPVHDSNDHSMMLSIASRFDARPLRWPGILSEAGRPHVRLHLTAQLRPEPGS